jgi:hypothetical protein
MPRMTRRMGLLTVFLLLHTDSSECFASRYTFERSTIPTISVLPQFSTCIKPKSNSQLKLVRNDPDLVTKLTSPLAAGTLALPLVLAFGASLFDTSSLGGLTLFLSSPLIEAEVLNDMALALDLARFFGPPNLTIRVAAVLGRLAAMGADYLPDHFMHTEELVFQCFMLGLAWMALVKSAMPVILSVVASNITLRDGKAFSLLFGPAGMTWPQYKTLSATTLDWVTVEPGEIVTSDELSSLDAGNDENRIDKYIYWLYAGETVVESQGKNLHNVTRLVGGPTTCLKRDAGRGLLGEMRLLRHMQAKEMKIKERGGRLGKRKAKNSSRDRDIINNDKDGEVSTTTKSYRRTTVKAGDAGATLLRIHTSNLVMLMDQDVDLAHSVRSLLFHGMHTKLASRLEESTA